MASILAAVNEVNRKEGARMVIAGEEKVGKTTLVSSAPNSIFVPLEIGYGNVKVKKTPLLTTLAEVNQFLDECTYWANKKQFPFKTLVFDSVTALERLIHTEVVKSDPQYGKVRNEMSMETAHGGYGKAYVIANEWFGQFLAKCDILSVYHGINIVFTCHVFSSEVVDPSAGTYNKWDLLLHSPKNQRTYGKRELFTQWLDLIGFLHDPITVTSMNGTNVAISTGGGNRLLGLSRTCSYVAGNRYNIIDSLTIPPPPFNGWNLLSETIKAKCGLDINS